MKKLLILLSILSVLILMSGTAMAQLNGTKTIDPSGSGPDNYTTFAAAISDLNTNGTTTGVTFLIATGTYNEPAPLVINPTVARPTSANPVTFVVASGATVILNITVAAGQWGITDSADYITFDGSNSGGADRSWTINVNDATTGYYGILVFGDNVTIKNITLLLANPWSTAPAQGIVLHQTGSSDNCTVQNCDVTANYAILVGTGSGTSQTGNMIKNNSVHCWNRGIYAAQSTSVTIQNNTVIGETSRYPTTTAYAIYASGPTGNTGEILITGNTVHDFGSNSGTIAAQTMHVVAAYGSAYFTISNNMIYNVFNATTLGTTALNLNCIYMSSSSGQNIARYEVFNNVVTGFLDNDIRLHSGWTSGIRYNTYGGRANIYNNSIYIGQTVQRAHNVAAFIGGTNTTVVSDTVFLRNNIFWTSATGYSSSYKSHAIYKGGSFLGTIVSDFNCVYNDGGGVNSYNAGSTSTTLANWIAGQDLHSVCKAVSFVNASNDLHLAGASLGDASLTGTPNLGWTVTSIPLDIDGNARNAKYPYMGADEASAPLAAIGVSSNAVNFGNVLVGDSLVVTVYVKSLTKNNITVTSLISPVSDFSWVLAVPVTIADSVAVPIKFKPHALGTYYDVLTITSDIGTAIISLTGKSASQPLSGNYTINGSGSTVGTNFKTFADACNALSIKSVAGPVTFSIANGTYNEAGPLVINPTEARPTVANPVTFVVATGATVVLNIAALAGQWGLTDSADYVLFNGSNSGSTDRSWTINMVGDSASFGVLVCGDNVQLKNLVITLGLPWNLTTASQGIVLHQTGASDNCVIENCDVTANYGILVGTSAVTTQTGNVIKNNTVHCLARGIVANQSTDITIRDNTVIGHSTLYPLVEGYGIYASNSTTTSGTVLIEGNSIHDLGTNSGTTAAVTISGIKAGSKGAVYTINRNKVYNIFNATSNATTNVQVQGITLSNGDQSSQFVVSNNFIYGLEDNDADENSNWTAGIRPITAGKVYVHYNTVYVKKTTRAHYAAAFICGGGIDAKDTNFVFNNLFYVRQTGFSSGKKSYCIYKGTSHLGSMVTDYNLLFNDGGGSYSSIGSPSGATFAAWQASGRDLHSASKTVAFVDSVNDLHLTGSSLGDGALAAIPIAGITTDIDGETRNAGHPYMGADEAAVPLTGISVSKNFVAFNQCAVGDSLVDTVYIKAFYKKEFTVTSLGSPSADFTWALAVPGTIKDSAAIVVTFKPHAFGSFVDTVKIITDFGTASVSLAGLSPKPVLIASVQSLAFGNIKVDSTVVLTIAIRDSSINRLVIDSIYTKTSVFLVDRSNASILSDTLTLLVAFMPTTSGTFVDTVYLKNNSATQLIKIPLSGSASPSAGVETGAEVPHVFALRQNYPNPFNPSTKVEFTVHQDGYTTLRVYNILGKLVSTLFSGVAQAGKLYQCSFEGSSLPTGIYFARLESGNQSSMRKMLLVK